MMAFRPGLMNLDALMGARGGPAFQPPQQPPLSPGWGGPPPISGPMSGPMPFQPPAGPVQPSPVPPVSGPMPFHPGLLGGQPSMQGPMPFQGGPSQPNSGSINLGAMGGFQPSQDMMQFLRSYSQMRQPQRGSY